MSKASIILIVFGVIIILFPEIIALLIGGVLVFIGVNLFLVGKGFSNTSGGEQGKESYVKFGDYKIYRGKK